MDDYERVLLVKPDVHVYKIPPRVTNRAYRASDWNLDTPDWNCRLRLISKGDECYIKLDEKSTGQFFGKCPIDKYPGTAVESVSDSSRYFVLRLLNEQTGRTAFVGIGFVDRSDSFDLNVSLQDHFKSLSSDNKNGENDTEDNTPKLDLKFKEGQTIKVNLNIGTKSNSKPRPKPMANIQGSSGGILLPPPPSNMNKSSSLSIDRNTDGFTSTNLLIDHSETQEQKAFQDDNVDSSNDKSDGDNDPQSNPISVPDWVCFKSTESTLVDNGPFSSNITTKPIDDGSVGGDLHKDLWSDFTSCNPTTTATTITDSSASETSNNNNKFDDWAKFF